MECENLEEEDLEEEEDEGDEEDIFYFDYVRTVRRGVKGEFEIEISAIDYTSILRLSRDQVLKLIKEITRVMSKDEIKELISSALDSIK